MSGSTETITLEILAKDLASGNIQQFIGHVDEAAKKGGILGSVFQGVGQHVGQSIASMINPTGLLVNVLDNAASAAMDIGKETLQQAIEGQAIAAQLDTALKDNIASWNGDKSAIEAASKAAERYAFVNDDVEKSVMGLVVHTHNLQDALDIVTVGEDLARMKGISLETATALLGKAYDGNTSALKRMGIQVDKGAKGMDAIRQVAKATAGQADKTASTFVGQMGRMGAAIQNTEENIGTNLIPTLTDWVTQLNNVLFNANAILGTVTGTVPPNWRDYGHGGGGGSGDQGSTTGDGGRYARRHHRSRTPGAAAGINIHFHSAYPPSPAEGQRLAQAVVPHIENEMRRRGSLAER